MPSLTQVNSETPVANHAAGVLQALLEAAAGAALPEWAMVAGTLKLSTVDAGGTVFLQDTAHPFVYAVRQGLFKLSYLNEDGSEWIKSFAEEGRFFASISALQTQGRTSFMVTALESSIVERLDYRLLSALATRYLPWSEALRKLTLVFAARKEQRERELLTLKPEQRYLAFCAAHPDLATRIAQKELARHLGMTPVGLNRIAVRNRRAHA